MIKAIGYAAQHSYSRLRPIEFERDEPKPHEIEIDVMFCGVCHSDAAVQTGCLGNSFPIVTGNELIGAFDINLHQYDLTLAGDVAAVPASEKRGKRGDRVGAPWHGGHDCEWKLLSKLASIH